MRLKPLLFSNIPLGLIMKSKLNFLLLITTIIISFSCKNEKEVILKESIDTLKTDVSKDKLQTIIKSNFTTTHTPRTLSSDYTIHSIGHNDVLDDTEKDTTYTIGDNRYMIAKKGYLLFNNHKIELENEMRIEKAFLTEDKNNIFLFYTYADYDSAGSRALSIDKESLEIKWNQHIGAFNLSKPVIDHDVVYISSFGHFSKLSLKTGEFYWRLDDLYEKYKMNNLIQLITYDSINLYIYPERHPSKSYDSLFVNDVTGKIIKDHAIDRASKN